MAELSETVECAEPIEPVQATSEPVSKWRRWRLQGRALIDYLLDSEVHTFAFSVAANAILSFIPFVVLLYQIAHSFFHSDTMARVVDQMVSSYLPAATHQHDWMATNIESYAVAFSSRHGLQALSVVMILISCTGIFLPLEVALNQAWGVTKSRNYLMNQVVAFGLAIVMVVLGMASIFANLGAQKFLAIVFIHHTRFVHIDNFFQFVFNSLSYVWLALTTGAASILFFFAIYWVLPNCRVPWRPVLRTSIVTGLIWLGAKYGWAFLLPHLDLKGLYGPFFISVGLLLWAYISGLILFAGAQFSVRHVGRKE